MKTTYGSWVRPKIAGIESSAKSTSVVPIASITISIGVISRRPFSRTKSLVPWYLSVEGKRCSMDLSRRFSSNSSSSSPARASLISFHAVQTRNAPKM